MKADKILHILAGYAIAMTIGLWWPIIGFCIALAAGAAKELIYDLALRKGTPDWYDFIFTVGGASVALAILNLNHVTRLL